MLGRDHHDVSGTIPPFRETSNIKDGSNVMADMAVQCLPVTCAGHEHGAAQWRRVGIGKAINGGFGMVRRLPKVDEIRCHTMGYFARGGGNAPFVSKGTTGIPWKPARSSNRTHSDGYHITIPPRGG